MLLILTSSYSGLLSLAAHCSKNFKKKKNCLIKHVCPFSTFPLTRSIFFAFSRLFASCFPSKKFFFFGFSLLPCLCLCLLSVFYFILFFIFFALPQPKPLLPFPQTTPPNPSALHYSLWPNPPSQTHIFSSSSDRTTFLSLTEPKNPILKPIFSSQNRRFKGGD